MSYHPYPTRAPVKNYFPLLNEIFDFDLHSTAIALYAYFMKLENRKTYDCFPSYDTIKAAIGVKSVTTIAKDVREFEDKHLIVTEQRRVPVDVGIVRKSTLRYNIRPIQEVVDAQNEVQMTAMELGVSQMKAQARAKKLGVEFTLASDGQSA